MRILFAGGNARTLVCLKQVMKRYEVVGMIAPPKLDRNSELLKLIDSHQILLLQPEDINSQHFVEDVKKLSPDITILAGCSSIVRTNFLNISPHGCINLHAGRLPQYRGSSPMNWALINGETTFSISIIKADEGIDTGDIAAERSFDIAPDSDINHLHKIANANYPEMLMDVLAQIDKDGLDLRQQDACGQSYYPLRFPGDGFILFDCFTADEIHNRVRALTTPYPCAFTFLGNRKLKIVKTTLFEKSFFGEPGRIYKKLDNRLLVCAKDKCLWIDSLKDYDTDEEVIPQLARYKKLATVVDGIQKVFEST